MHDGKLLEFKRLHELYPKYKWANILRHPAMVLIPYQVSTMFFFELYRMNLPLFVPSLKLLSTWAREHGVMWERVYGTPERQPHTESDAEPGNPNTNASLEYWLGHADFYVFPHVQLFDSWDDLLRQLATTSLREVSERMRAHNAEQRREQLDTWREILTTANAVANRSRALLRDPPRDLDAALERYWGLGPLPPDPPRARAQCHEPAQQQQQHHDAGHTNVMQLLGPVEGGSSGGAPRSPRGGGAKSGGVFDSKRKVSCPSSEGALGSFSFLWVIDLVSKSYTAVLNRQVDDAGLATYACATTSARWQIGPAKYRAHVRAMLCRSDEYYQNMNNGQRLTDPCARRCGDRLTKFARRFARGCADWKHRQHNVGAAAPQQGAAPAQRAPAASATAVSKAQARETLDKALRDNVRQPRTFRLPSRSGMGRFGRGGGGLPGFMGRFT